MMIMMVVVVVSRRALLLVSPTGFRHGGLSLSSLPMCLGSVRIRGIQNVAFDDFAWLLRHLSFHSNSIPRTRTNMASPSFVVVAVVPGPRHPQASTQTQKHAVLQRCMTQHDAAQWPDVQQHHRSIDNDQLSATNLQSEWRSGHWSFGQAVDPIWYGVNARRKARLDRDDGQQSKQHNE